MGNHVLEKIEELNTLNTVLDKKKTELDETSSFNVTKRAELAEFMYLTQRKINELCYQILFQLAG